jgi:transcriptional regulator with XRE-family HTH domain
MAVAGARAELGELLRHWRRVRGKSQLDLALEATTTPRYVSFVETGRSQPSRQMVVRLARALDVPLRERNDLLLAAGYAPLYGAGALDGPELGRLRGALGAMLAQHEPFPAVVMDRAWNVLQANGGAERLFGTLCAPVAPPDPANVLEMMLASGPIREAVVNWRDVAPALLERCRREAVGGVIDGETSARMQRLRTLPEVADAIRDVAPGAGISPVIDIVFAVERRKLAFFSVVSTVGTPVDVTAQEIRLEAFFPSDESSRAAWAAT